MGFSIDLILRISCFHHPIVQRLSFSTGQSQNGCQAFSCLSLLLPSLSFSHSASSACMNGAMAKRMISRGCLHMHLCIHLARALLSSFARAARDAPLLGAPPHAPCCRVPQVTDGGITQQCWQQRPTVLGSVLCLSCQAVSDAAGFFSPTASAALLTPLNCQLRGSPRSSSHSARSASPKHQLHPLLPTISGRLEQAELPLGEEHTTTGELGDGGRGTPAEAPNHDCPWRASVTSRYSMMIFDVLNTCITWYT